MKTICIFLLSMACLHLYACNGKIENVQVNNLENSATTDTMKLKMTIGSAIFTATLENNATVKAFTAMLPLTINMEDLNGNEKFYYLSNTLPTKSSNIGTIQTGDLMLYGNNCFVVFYKPFNTSYSYTKLGHVDDPSELPAALGSGNVTVKLELE